MLNFTTMEWTRPHYHWAPFVLGPPQGLSFEVG